MGHAAPTPSNISPAVTLFDQPAQPAAPQHQAPGLGAMSRPPNLSVLSPKLPRNSLVDQPAAAEESKLLSQVGYFDRRRATQAIKPSALLDLAGKRDKAS